MKTNLTTNKRDQLKNQLDDFATFQWRGHDMFEDFGCFIINENKTGLKFYNGPGFSNQYAKTQFSDQTNMLLGIDFKQQTIPFKVGLYWFTIEEYQNFLNCISPYEINYLTFSFEPNYSYLVKLGGIQDSVRTIVGYNEEGKPVYYTELELKWELLGDNCVRSTHPYEYIASRSSGLNWTWKYNTQSENQDSSCLDTPVLFEIPLEFVRSTASISLVAKNNDIEVELFNIDLQNLIINPTIQSTAENLTWESLQDNQYTLFLRYDSETGLMYVQQGDNDTWHLLNYQTTADTGKYLWKSGVINKWKIPGKFTANNLDSRNWEFTLITSYATVVESSLQVSDKAKDMALTVYTRKNVV